VLESSFINPFWQNNGGYLRLNDLIDSKKIVNYTLYQAFWQKFSDSGEEGEANL
jgi:hypothetical protein